MSAMNLTSVVGGIMALIGALAAWRFLPNRKQFGAMGAPAGPPAAAGPAEEPKHLDVDAAPDPTHAGHVAEHARLDTSLEPDGRHELVDEFGDPVVADEAVAEDAR